MESEAKKVTQEVLDTNLSWAVVTQDARAVESLILQGADPRFVDESRGISLLRLACSSPSGEIIRLLIAAGADVNEQDYRTGDSLAMIAFANKKNIPLSLLILFGANLALKNKAGKSIHDLECSDEFKTAFTTTLAKASETRNLYIQTIKEMDEFFSRSGLQTVFWKIIYEYSKNDLHIKLPAKFFETSCIIS